MVRNINKVLRNIMQEKSVKLNYSSVNTTMLGFRADDGVVISPG